MVPVLLAPPPWANAVEPNDSATNKARRPVVQRLMLSSSSGDKNRRPEQHNTNNDFRRRRKLQMSPEVTDKHTAERVELQETGLNGCSGGTDESGDLVIL